MNMRKAEIYYNNKSAGYLFENNDKYFFKYNEPYLLDICNPAISVTLPKSKEVFISKHLFPFFFGLLSEGDNKKMQCEKLKINEDDYFSRLLKTSNHDTAGGITVKEL
jgi:HipA-like protein